MRTIILRSVQALLALSAVAMMTGANDAGCNVMGSSSGSGSDSATSTTSTTGTGAGGYSTSGSGGSMACPDGTIPQLVCDGEPPPGMKPDQPLNYKGTSAATTGTGMGGSTMIPGTTVAATTGTGMGGSTMTGCNPPPKPGCNWVCVAPPPPMCPTGYHVEKSCTGGGTTGSGAPGMTTTTGTGMGGAEMIPPPPPPGKGTTTTTGTGMGGAEMIPPSTSSGMGMGGGECTAICVADDVCPPGTVETTVCEGSSTGTGMGGAGGATTTTGTGMGGDGKPLPPIDMKCWNTCVAEPPPMCPSGTHAAKACPPNSTDCVPVCEPDEQPAQ